MKTLGWAFLSFLLLAAFIVGFVALMYKAIIADRRRIVEHRYN